MIFVKFVGYTCAFYVLGTAALLVGMWVFVQVGPVVGFHFSNRGSLFWSLGVRWAAPLALIWLMSFSAAWWIVSREMQRLLGAAAGN